VGNELGEIVKVLSKAVTIIESQNKAILTLQSRADLQEVRIKELERK
jgi:hypothetical protein